MTGISVRFGWGAEKVGERGDEINRVGVLYDFDEIFVLDFPTTRLDQVPVSDLVAAISQVFKSFEPQEIFVPHPSDVHTDHRDVFNAVAACTKWFRYPSIKRVLGYETLSETDCGMGTDQGFRPNVFVDIEQFLDQKLRVMDVYKSEMDAFPFPRSHEAIRALAAIRGAAAGFKAAEAFQLLRERT